MNIDNMFEYWIIKDDNMITMMGVNFTSDRINTQALGWWLCCCMDER